MSIYSWLDPATVALGTKDNKVFRYFFWCSQISNLGMQFFTWNVSTNTYKPIPIPDIGSPVPMDSCGIHDIDISPSSTLIASGIAILSPFNQASYNSIRGAQSTRHYNIFG